MEMEVMEARLIRAAEINGEVDDDDAGGSQVEEAGGPEWQGLVPFLPWVITHPVRACLPSVSRFHTKTQ